MDEVILDVSREALKKAGAPTEVQPGRLTFRPTDKLLIATENPPQEQKL